jgi:hypothetical protein
VPVSTTDPQLIPFAALTRGFVACQVDQRVPSNRGSVTFLDREYFPPN